MRRARATAWPCSRRRRSRARRRLPVGVATRRAALRAATDGVRAPVAWRRARWLSPFGDHEARHPSRRDAGRRARRGQFRPSRSRSLSRTARWRWTWIRCRCSAVLERTFGFDVLTNPCSLLTWNGSSLIPVTTGLGEQEMQRLWTFWGKNASDLRVVGDGGKILRKR
jgi:hypothetical protein